MFAPALMSTEENGTRPRTVNLDVTRCAVGVLRVLVVLRSSRLSRADIVSHAVTGQTKLIDGAVSQQSCIRRAVRRVTGRAALSLHGRVFVRERSLLIHVALNASRVSSRSQARLFQLETAVRVMTVAAPHRALEHLVMEGHRELRLHLSVTTGAKLRVIRL